MPLVTIRYDLPLDARSQEEERTLIHEIAQALPQVIVAVFSVPGSPTAELRPDEVTVLPRPYLGGDVCDSNVLFIKVEVNDSKERHPRFMNSDVLIAEGVRSTGKVPRGMFIGVWVVPIQGGRYTEIRA